MPCLPGVSGSASSTVTSVMPLNWLDGLVAHVAMPTVPGTDCRMNPYHATGPGADAEAPDPSKPCPGGTGEMPPEPVAPERMSHDWTGCADVVSVCDGSAALPPVRRSP